MTQYVQLSISEVEMPNSEYERDSMEFLRDILYGPMSPDYEVFD